MTAHTVPSSLQHRVFAALAAFNLSEDLEESDDLLVTMVETLRVRTLAEFSLVVWHITNMSSSVVVSR